MSFKSNVNYVDMKGLLLVLIVIVWQVGECTEKTYAPTDPVTVTQSLFIIPTGTPPFNPNSTTSTTTPKDISSSTTLNKAPTSTTTTTVLPVSAVTPQIISSTTSRSWKTTKYSGYLLLNSTINGTSPKINQTELEKWLKQRTQQGFEILNISGRGFQGPTRQKRSNDQISSVTYEVQTNSTDFHEEFKNTENESRTSTIGTNKVEKAYLWPSDSNNCPDSTNCGNGTCRIYDNATFYCPRSGSGSTAPKPSGDDRHLLGLIAIPCIIVLILLIILIVFLVRRHRNEKHKQDITKIHPAGYTLDKEVYLDSVTKRSLEGFDSMRSSNFEYENGKVEHGLF